MRRLKALTATAAGLALLLPAGARAETTRVATLVAPFAGAFTSDVNCRDVTGLATSDARMASTGDGSVSMAVEAQGSAPASAGLNCTAIGYTQRIAGAGFRLSIPLPGYGTYAVTATFSLGTRDASADRPDVPGNAIVTGSAHADIDARLDVRFIGCDSSCRQRDSEVGTTSIARANTSASTPVVGPPTRTVTSSDTVTVVAVVDPIYVGPENYLEVYATLQGWAGVSGYGHASATTAARLVSITVDREA